MHFLFIQKALCMFMVFYIPRHIPLNIQDFQKSCLHPFKDISLSCFSASLLFAQMSTAISGTCDVKQLPLFFLQIPWKYFSYWRSFGSDKIYTSPVNQTCLQSLQECGIVTVPENGFILVSYNLILFSTILLVFWFS